MIPEGLYELVMLLPPVWIPVEWAIGSVYVAAAVIEQIMWCRRYR